ncbi:ABC transporter permease [Streptomyces sp. ACT015]|uniref:ABC transporter permease n=1 Tax=Streptomyces sp. ACT015 TaxID=3134807 RepID=UPI003D16C0EC
MTAPAVPAAPRAIRVPRQLVGTATLLRLALRRDRLFLPAWVAVPALIVLATPGALDGLYGTASARASLFHQVAANPSFRALIGPLHGTSTGALTAWRVGVYAAALAAAAGLLVVVRHTRDEEESGRQELIASGAVGRRAALTSALLTALVADAALALLVTAGLAARGVAGALALGLGLGATGLVFGSAAAVVAQLTESARAARGLTAALLGAAFALRAAGDATTPDGSSAATWLSPLGWLENLRPYARERWWVLGLFAAAVAVQTAAAYALAGRRDLGASFLPTRPGPAAGRLGTAGALAGRLHRGSLLGWSAAFLAAGIVYGSLTDSVAGIVQDSAGARAIFRRTGGPAAPADAFLASMTGMLAMLAALFAVASVLRAHTEETSGRAEPLLAAPLGRLRWAAGHLTVAFAGSALLMVVAGLGLTAGYGARPAALLGACLVRLPAVWAVGGLAVLLYGWAPRYARVAWAVALAALLTGWVGPALDAPRAVLDLSPFTHLPPLPGAPVQWPPVLALTVLAALLTGAGLVGLRRRDLTG